MNDPAGNYDHLRTIRTFAKHAIRLRRDGGVLFAVCDGDSGNGGYCPLRPYLFHYSSEPDCHSRPWARRLQAKLNPPRIVD